MSIFRLLSQILHGTIRRLRRGGVRATLIWLYGRGIPFITGQPLIRYSQITSQIYVGAQHNQAGKLERLNINGDVNMRSEFDDATNGLALDHYCYLPTVDGQAPTIEQLIEGVIFIKNLLADGGKVYIHCNAGVGRAPTMAAAPRILSL